VKPSGTLLDEAVDRLLSPLYCGRIKLYVHPINLF